MDFSKSLEIQRSELLSLYKGRNVNELPTPSFIMDLNVVRANTKAMLDGLNSVIPDLKFRPHVKTHKTAEIVRLQLDNGTKHKAVVASTIREIRGLLPLVSDGTVNDVLYGIPPTKSKVPELAILADELSRHKAVLRLMIDSPEQLRFLRSAAGTNKELPKWSVFFKINVGDDRAGQRLGSNALEELVREVIDLVSDQSVDLYGFYAHAGGSYASTNVDKALEYLTKEVKAVSEAANYARTLMAKSYADTNHRFVLSVGATPTAHTSSRAVPSIQKLFAAVMENDSLEIHAGNYAILDMQQVATGLVSPSDVAGKVLAEIISYYPERNEYLIDAGVTALAREPGRIPGIATIQGQRISGDRWIVGRVSQEHGILCHRTDTVANVIEAVDADGQIRKSWKIGDKILLLPQHTCITSSQYQWYFAVEDEVVVDVLLPWRGW